MSRLEPSFSAILVGLVCVCVSVCTRYGRSIKTIRMAKTPAAGCRRTKRNTRTRVQRPRKTSPMARDTVKRLLSRYTPLPTVMTIWRLGAGVWPLLYCIILHHFVNSPPWPNLWSLSLFISPSVLPPLNEDAVGKDGTDLVKTTVVLVSF